MKAAKNNGTKRYWEQYYQTKHSRAPSEFAQWLVDNVTFDPAASMVDLCCGNGRDTYWLAQAVASIIGVDYAAEPLPQANATFVKASLQDFITQQPAPLYVYCRFGLHAVPEEVEDLVLNWVYRYLFIEARSDEGVCPSADHYRRLLNGDMLVAKLLRLGFDVQHYSIGTGYAPLPGVEDPVIIRVIAQKED
jgi:SAM-dependent methyltransferase